MNRNRLKVGVQQYESDNMQLRTIELIQQKTSPATASCQIFSISPFVSVLIICLSLEIGACTEDIIWYCLIEISVLFNLVCVFIL